MTVPQSNAAPIASTSSLQIITLKNLVALDLVQQNEALLKSFNLLDTSSIQTKQISTPLTKEEIQSRIKKLQDELETPDQIKQYKSEINSSKDIKSKQLLDSLAAEFLEDSIPNDDTDNLIKQFEIENNAKIYIQDRFDNLNGYKGYYNVNATKIKDRVKKEELQKEQNDQTNEPQDVEMN